MRSHMKPKGISILGSTGSIGCNTLRVVESLGNEGFRVIALGAGRPVDDGVVIELDLPSYGATIVGWDDRP